MSHKSNVADYDLLYIGETERGLHVRRSEDDESFWLPKSQIEFADRNYRRHQTVSVAIPDWLAEAHDLA